VANLPENPFWEPGIYQIENVDPVSGGAPDLAQGRGINNVAAQQLAKRTSWLKQQVDAIPGAYARQQDVTNAINALIGGAPAALDTLKEIADALDSKGNFATWVIGELRKASPIGEVKIWTDDTAPIGSLEGDRAAYLRADYPLFWAYIQSSAMYDATGATEYMFGPGNGTTTFQMPETRGEFLRFWDHGRGVDDGRALGSWQDFAMENITGTVGAFKSNGGSMMSGAFAQEGPIAGGSHDAAGSGPRAANFDASRVVKTALKTRPRNIAYMAVFRAY